MIDRIAEALMRFDGLDPNGPESDDPQRSIEAYRRRAHMVLTAMVEPTEAMLAATDKFDWPGPTDSTVDGPADPETCWRAMIDAARQS